MTVTTVGCGTCGAAVLDASAAFCASCGTSLRPAPPSFPPPTAPPAAPAWYGAPPQAHYQQPAANAWAAPASGGYPQGGWAAPEPSDGLGIASLVLSLVWVLGLGSIAAVVLGHMSRSRAKQGRRAPSGVSLAGLIIGYVGVFGTTILIVLAFIGADAAQRGLDMRRSVSSAAIAEESYASANNGAFTDNLQALADHGFVAAPGITVNVVDAQNQRFCLVAVGGRIDPPWYESSEDGLPTTYPCS